MTRHERRGTGEVAYLFLVRLLLRTYEQDVRERIALAIEAERELRKSSPTWWSPEVGAALDEAVLIARDGGAR